MVSRKILLVALSMVLAISFQAHAFEVSPVAHNEVAFVAEKVDQPAAAFTAAESVVLFVAAVSAAALVSRRSRLAIKTTYRAFAKTFVAVARSGVQKLTENHRRSNSKHDELFAMIGAGSGEAPIGSGSGG